MRTKNGGLIQIAITLQVFVLLFATLMVPAATAADVTLPPLAISGDVKINGEPAPLGTVITADVNDGEFISTVTVENEGIYGDTGLNKIHVPSLGDEDDVKFSVDGIEASIDLDSLITAGAGEFITVDLAVNKAAESSTSKSSGGGGFGGSSGGSATTVEAEEVAAEEEETLMSTTEDAQSDEPVETPSAESNSSLGSIGLIAIGLLLLTGAIVTVKYKFQK